MPASAPWPDVAPATRNVMRANRSKDTKPEMAVRRMLHAMGYRYRLHRRDLPGYPDIVFPGRRKVVFIHGCFWHHHDCQKGRLPATRTGFWQAKLTRNRDRDARNRVVFESFGWKVATVWECELTAHEALSKRLVGFLSGAES